MDIHIAMKIIDMDMKQNTGVKIPPIIFLCVSYLGVSPD